jgi:hypothetical protein
MKKYSALLAIAVILTGCAPIEESSVDLPESVETEIAEAPTSEPESSEPDSTASNACEPFGSLLIIRAEDGCIEPWPLDSKSGILYCDPFNEGIDSVVYQPDEDISVYYALNGTALGAGYPDIEPLWLDDADMGGGKVSLGKMLDEGLALCGK